MYTDKVLDSEQLTYIDENGLHYIIEIYFLIDEIKAFASLIDDVDEEIVGFGTHPYNREFALNNAISDLLNYFKNRMN